MFDAFLFLLKNYGMKIALILAGVFVALVLGKMIIEKLFALLEIRARSNADIALKQKDYDLKVAEEQRRKVEAIDHRLKSLVKRFHEMLDELIEDERQFYDLIGRPCDPRVWNYRFNGHLRGLISLTRTNTNFLGSEAVGHIEGELARLARMLMVDWEQRGKDMQYQPLMFPKVDFDESAKNLSYKILRDLMDYVNRLYQPSSPV